MVNRPRGGPPAAGACSPPAMGTSLPVGKRRPNPCASQERHHLRKWGLRLRRSGAQNGPNETERNLRFDILDSFFRKICQRRRRDCSKTAWIGVRSSPLAFTLVLGAASADSYPSIICSIILTTLTPGRSEPRAAIANEWARRTRSRAGFPTTV